MRLSRGSISVVGAVRGSFVPGLREFGELLSVGVPTVLGSCLLGIETLAMIRPGGTS
jgi:hypothetical protein